MTKSEVKKPESDLNDLCEILFGVPEKYLVVSGNEIKADVGLMSANGIEVTRDGPFASGQLYKSRIAAGKLPENP
jgi:hypothetical protein